MHYDRLRTRATMTTPTTTSATACKPITIATVLRPGAPAKSNKGRSGGAGCGAGGVTREAAGYVARLAAINCGVAANLVVGEAIGAGVAVGSTASATVVA